MPQPDPRIVNAARLQQAKDFPAAEQIYRQILRNQPNHIDALFLLGLLLHQTGRNEAAVEPLRRAIALKPGEIDFQKIIVETLRAAGRVPEAIVEAQRLIHLQPGVAGYHFGLGEMFLRLGRIPEAIGAFTSGLTLAPQNDAALNNLGTCYILSARPEEAIPYFQAAVRLRPDVPEPRNNIGAALLDCGRLDEAIAAFEETRRLHPTYADASNNLGNCYSTVGEHSKAIAAYRQAITVRPTFAGSHSNLLMCLLYPPGSDERAINAEHLAWDRQHAEPLKPEILPPQNDFTPNRRLRIGYVSPDFREHSVRYFIEPILASHDRGQFEVYCYACGQRRDDVTQRLQSHAASWHDVAGLNDAALANLIRSHRIDILIDLAGHTSDNRMLTFARKPAPVQVTYLGYPTTTGLSAIDYRLTDSITDPTPASAELHREELIHLPRAFFVFGDDRDAAFDPKLPADTNGFITFGSFNNSSKMNAAVLSAWAKILLAVPGSRLLMKAKALANLSTRQRIGQFFTSNGIDAQRLDLRAWVPLAHHMHLLGSVDLTLDTFPYNGHTTSCQSLWMGAPFVTVAGNSFRSRVGASILHHLELPELLAANEAEYVILAANLANDRPRLRQLRGSLRERMLGSTLTDAKRFTADLEDLYRKIWQRACTARQ